jgi:hypothetical protein
MKIGQLQAGRTHLELAAALFDWSQTYLTSWCHRTEAGKPHLKLAAALQRDARGFTDGCQGQEAKAAWGLGCLLVAGHLACLWLCLDLIYALHRAWLLVRAWQLVEGLVAVGRSRSLVCESPGQRIAARLSKLCSGRDQCVGCAAGL